MSELEQQVFEFDIGSMEEVKHWRIRFNYVCRVRNPQNWTSGPTPCKHCVSIEEQVEFLKHAEYQLRGQPKDIIKTWVCPHVIEASAYDGYGIVCLDCVLEVAESLQKE